MYKSFHLANLNLKCIQILTIILLSPLFAIAQTPAERAKITSEYDQKSSATLKAKLQQAHDEREARVALYLQQKTVARSFSKGKVLYSIYDIAPDGTPIYINTKNVESGQVIKANKLYNGGGLSLNIQGQGMTVGVWDGGPVRATHELLAGQATQIDGSALTDVGGRDHMAHVTGTIVGKALPSGNAQAMSARGIAFNATARCYDWNNDLTEMATFAIDGYLISNHSYGPNNAVGDPAWELGAYREKGPLFDEIVKTYPNYLPFIAGGNEQATSANAASKMGYDVMSGMNVGKNVMTVGAINGNLTMSGYSNWGPTDDGRFKPDIVAKGTGINSAQSTADNAYSGTDTSSSGTSYASPAAAALGLLLQQYHNAAKSTYLEAAGIKGLMLHTATDLGQPGPDYKFGWGVADGEQAAQTITASNSDLANNNSTTKIAKITTNPAVGASLTYTLKAKGGSTPLSASICWTDDEAAEQLIGEGVDPTTGRLVYNFDIKLVDQVTNQEYFPWKGPGMANRTQNSTRTGPNDVDNFKKVDIDAPVAGRNYQLVISKRNAMPAAARQFTIVWTGLQGSALPVELNAFTAKVVGKKRALLNWSTASEKNNLGFEVEMSAVTEGTVFRKVGFVKGNGTSATTQNYQFTTDDLQAGIYYFRLKQLDIDGQMVYSTVKSVEVKDDVVTSVYPNPAKDMIHLDINLEAGANVTATIFNQLGQVSQIILPKQYLEVGKYNFSVPTTNLANGIYFYQLTIGNTVSQGKLVVNK
jgi:serine protease AprX